MDYKKNNKYHNNKYRKYNNRNNNYKKQYQYYKKHNNNYYDKLNNHDIIEKNNDLVVEEQSLNNDSNDVEFEKNTISNKEIDNSIMFNNDENKSLDFKNIVSNVNTNDNKDDYVSIEEPVLIKKDNNIVVKNDIDKVEEKVTKRKPIFRYILGPLLILFAILGTTYAYFTYYQETTNQGDIVAGEVYIKLQENPTPVLTINKLYPRTDEEARARSDNYVDFTILGKNTSTNMDLGYKFNISLNDVPSGKISVDPENLKFDLYSLDSNNNETPIFLGIGFNEINEPIPGLVVSRNTLTEISRKYRIRVWMKDTVIISDTEPNRTYTQEEFSKLMANISVNVMNSEPIKTASGVLLERLSNQSSCTTTAPNKSSFYGEIDADVIYYTGNDESCLKNYVWYSGKLWRIVAIYPNGMIKLVTENNMTAIGFGSTVTFDGSWMDQWLSEEFLPTLYNNTNIVVQNAEWNVKETTLDTDPYLERVTNDTITKTVGLLNAFEYTKSGAGSGYLHIGQYWWLMTPNSSSRLRYVDFQYGTLKYELPGFQYGARPSIVIKSNAVFDTENYDGTRLSPFHIIGDIEEGKTNELLNTRISGEYVLFNYEIYRIVGIENNTTKIVNTGYIQNPNISNSDKYSGNFGSDVYFNTQSTDMKYWDKYLTDESGWLSTISSDDKNMLVNGTYFLGLYPSSTNYKATICKNTASELETTTISNCTKYESSDTNKTYTGLVGLLRAGEMMSAPQSTFAHFNSYAAYKTMWLITPYSSSRVHTMGSDSVLFSYSPESSVFRVRPSINLKSETKITGGSGFINDPYEVG